jgi:hypothetical protein
VLVLNRTLAPPAEAPSETKREESKGELNIWVVFTSMDAIVAALKEAGTLAGTLGARITILVPQVVPYPLPLESPPVLLDWTEKRFQLISTLSPVETTVRIYLCRDRLDAAASVFNPDSIVVVGARKKWWPTFESRLARKLQSSGHHVILTETE